MQPTPKRVVLRFSVQYEFEDRVMIDTFFTSHEHVVGISDDYFWRVCCSDDPSKLLIIIDLHSKTIPDVDVQNIEHLVYKVRKNKNLDLYVHEPLRPSLT
jgi:hypothetical protein